ncbi:MAG: hypothetical protein IJW78_03455 [Clostridia bacterium]|nr:hypothetical protein [Clostridia bacterium]
MSINSLATASRYTGELDKIFTEKSAVGFLADNNLRSRFVGAKTVIMPDIDFVGLADYNRDTGFSQGAVTVSQTAYTLTKDRGRSFMIDREDMDETGVMSLAGQVLSEFIRTEVVPEVDAYTISKLAGVAADNGHVETYNEAKALTQLLSMINALQASVGYDTELVAFIDNTMKAAIENDEKISKQIVVSDFKQGDIHLRIKSLDGVALIPVQDSRMKSAYTFDAGTTTTAGGFAPTEDAQSIRALVLPKKGASLVKKSETLRIFAPEQNVKADAYKFDYRLYYDTFVKKSELGNIYALQTA